MGLPKLLRLYTPQEYFALERQADYRSEYFKGEIFAMSGGTRRHSVIAVNILAGLHSRMINSPCTPHEANFRLKIKATGLLTYPDVSVYCGDVEFDPEDEQNETGLNPTVVFEVLSKTTEAYDRGAKSAHYRQIESLKAYLLVSQKAPHVELYSRSPDGSWRLTEATALESTVRIPGIDVDLPLAEVYAKVVFPESPSSRTEDD